jgi:hypothetical protein
MSAVEALYTAFAAYPLRADTNACPCCHKPEEERVLHSRPLRELSANDLRMYAADAIFVWGSEDDFRHFLPRIFELMVTVADPVFEMDDPSIAFNKLHHGHWENWPAKEQEAIRRYFLAAWKAFLQANPDDCLLTDADSWLCGIAQAENDIQPYLAALEDNKSVEAARHLSVLIVEHAFIQDDAHPANFWAKRKSQWEQVRKWLQGGGAKQILKDVDPSDRDDKVELAMQVMRVM